MHYLVTGGAGFIGSHIVDALVEKGDSVTVLDDLSAGNMKNLSENSDKIKLIRKSITDKDVLSDACRDVDFIFHEAAIASVPFSIDNPSVSHEANLTGTLNILEAARKSDVGKIVMASSAAIYGNNPEMPKTEDMPPEPMSPYAVQKLSSEYYGNVYSDLYSIDFAALRYFNVFGPRQLLGSSYAAAIPAFINAIIKGQQPVVFGDGNQTRDFVYIKDIVSANLKAMESNAKGVFNVSCNKGTSLNELLEIMGEISGVKVKPIYSKPRPGDVRYSYADYSKFSDACGWKPKVSLKDGLLETFDFFKSL